MGGCCMEKMGEYFAKHSTCNALTHLSMGLGIAWLVSLAWYCSIVALVLGIAFLVGGIAGHIYARFAKQ
ncbi:hypothetical protein ES703_42430 [subsurface metagenome]